MLIMETSFESVLAPWYSANCSTAHQCAPTLPEKTSHKCIWTKTLPQQLSSIVFRLHRKGYASRQLTSLNKLLSHKKMPG
ncbi:hypothetical protein pdam_00021710 [Pocillopora damicornis]|uniref:Uncharacterized protein n=1 Tax=Pocillopora damicornis TaxID=46731 RepID=A0A3M6UZB6_POCDA|nr:hypothetical protein pdam_00021710 [Pocillopora damicornis]